MEEKKTYCMDNECDCKGICARFVHETPYPGARFYPKGHRMHVQSRCDDFKPKE